MGDAEFETLLAGSLVSERVFPKNLSYICYRPFGFSLDILAPETRLLDEKRRIMFSNVIPEQIS